MKSRISLGSQAAADQQVPTGAMRQTLWTDGRAGLPHWAAEVTSSQLLNSKLYSPSEA